MASRTEENEFMVGMMTAGKVTANETAAFMCQALVIMERDKPGTAHAFMRELIQRRSTRTFPDLSKHIR